MNENNANFTPTAPNFKTLVRMSFQGLTNFPYIEEDFDALTNYGLLSKVVEYLNEVISNNNNQSTLMTNLYNAYVSLEDYVNNYFDNLDVQDEINNKLDEMAESGQLTDIIAQYLGLAGMIAYDTVADMKLAENLVNGSKCRTLGYHSVNDGGGAYYKIRTVTNDDVVDEASIIEVYNNLLVAELITENNINAECFGAYGDNIHDDSIAINKIFTSPLKLNEISFTKEYYITSQILIENKDNLTINGNGIIHIKSEEATNAHIAFRLNNCDNVEIKNLKFISSNDYQTEVPPDHTMVTNSRSSNINGITCVSSENVNIHDCKFDGIKTAITILGVSGTNIENANIENIIINNTQQFLVTNYLNNICINNVNFNEMQYTQHGFHFIYAHNDTRKITLLNSNCIGRSDTTADAVIVLESNLPQLYTDFYAENCNISGHRLLTLNNNNKNCVLKNCSLTNYGDVSPAAGTLVYLFTVRDSTSADDHVNIEFDNCILKYTTNGNRLTTANTNSKGYINCKLNNCKLYDVTLMDTNMPTIFDSCKFILSTFMYLSNNRPTAYYCNMIFNNCIFETTSSFAQTYMLSSRGLYGKILLKNCYADGNNINFFMYNDTGTNTQAFNNLVYNVTTTGFKSGASYKVGNNYLNGTIEE